MAHRRNQGPSTTTKPFSFDRNPISPPPPPPPPPPYSSDNPTTSSSSTSLAAKAIRASSAHKDSSLSSAYGQAALSSDSHTGSSFKDSTPPNDYTLNEPKHGFWGALARKAKAILEDDTHSHTPGTGTGPGTADTQTQKYHNLYRTPDSHRKQDTPPTTSHKKGLGAIASSLNSIGGAIGNALEVSALPVQEGLTVVENRTADIIQETRKLQIRKKGSTSQTESKAKAVYTARQQPSQMQTDQDIQLKASRDVAMAMAAKAKLLLRELKTVKADLAFAKERCAQLEDENKILRENRQNGSHLEDDDLIRLQLETLLAEKARLAQENSFYARENRFLREIVEYHQLTMQDVVYFDQGTEEVTEVYPIKVSSMTNPLPISTTLPPPPSRPAEALHDISLQGKQHVSPARMPPLEFMKASQNVVLLSSNSLNPAEDSKRDSIPSA